MTTLPLEMSVSAIKPHQAKEVLTCKKLLREVPNKRSVYMATWNGKNVIAKVFRGFGSGLRLKKEWNGLQQLLQRNLNTPHPCFYGTTDDNRKVLVIKEITNALTAFEIYQNDANQIGSHNLLSLVVKELAKLNNKGVLQKDIHLGNFLIDGEQVFSLDAGQMTFHTKPLSRQKSWGQLAAILAFSSDEQAPKNLCLEYAKIRNWDFSNLDEAAVKKHICSYRKYVIRRVLKKTLRTSKHFIKVKKNAYSGMFSKKFIGQSEPSRLFDQIDGLMDNGQILKKGNTCYVSRINLANKDLVVKRYNNKGFFYAIRNTLKGSRARRCWLYGHLLDLIGIPTPKPVYFFEERKGPLLWRSYLATEYVDGKNLHDFLRDNNTGKQQKAAMIQQALELIDKLHANRITHGDLKQSNILITTDGPVLTDLDAMEVHKLRLICWLKGRVYLKRFRQNTKEQDL